MDRCIECATLTDDCCECPGCGSFPLCPGCAAEHAETCDKPLRAWIRAGGHEYFVFYRPSQAVEAADALMDWVNNPELTLTQDHLDAFIEAMQERLRAMQ